MSDIDDTITIEKTITKTTWTIKGTGFKGDTLSKILKGIDSDDDVSDVSVEHVGSNGSGGAILPAATPQIEDVNVKRTTATQRVQKTVNEILASEGLDDDDVEESPLDKEAAALRDKSKNNKSKNNKSKTTPTKRKWRKPASRDSNRKPVKLIYLDEDSNEPEILNTPHGGIISVSLFFQKIDDVRETILRILTQHEGHMRNEILTKEMKINHRQLGTFKAKINDRCNQLIALQKHGSSNFNFHHARAGINYLIDTYEDKKGNKFVYLASDWTKHYRQKVYEVNENNLEVLKQYFANRSV